MAKVKQPLFSFDARRKLSDDIVFKRQGRTTIVETRPIPIDARSAGQLSWRHMFLKVVALWHALSAAEKEAWESLGRKRHMTGYAWFVSQALRPNPGIYLPLQGGTMSGAIDMDDQHIHGLPAPVHLQDPLRRQDYVDYIQPYLLTEGARVTNTTGTTIANGTETTLLWNAERWDTDTIHSVGVNTERLTCKTAGKYLIISQIHWVANGVGVRIVNLYLNGALNIASSGISANITWSCSTTPTIYDLVVGNFLTVKVYQNSGGNLAVGKGPNYSPEFMAQRIG